MWGFTSRGARLGEGRRAARTVQVGLTRMVVRGPVEHAVLELSGELDFSNADAVGAAIDALPHRLVSIDMAGLEFVDVAGARALELVVRGAATQGELPKLTGVTPAMQRTFGLVRSRGRVGKPVAR